MRAKINDKGLLIPKRFFKGFKEAEIKKENGLILVIPINSKDPVYELGKKPISSNVKDGSTKHDKYIYRK